MRHAYNEYCTLPDVGCANEKCPNARARKAEAHVDPDGNVVTDCCGYPALSEFGDPYTMEDFAVEHVDQKPWLKPPKIEPCGYSRPHGDCYHHKGVK